MKSFARVGYVTIASGFVFILGLSAVAQAASYAGSWVLRGAIMGRGTYIETIAPVCVFRQDGDEIQGTCKGSAGLGSVEGAVDGSTIVFHWNRIGTTSEQFTSTLTFKGVWGADGIIRGEWTDTAFPRVTGTFEAKKTS
jgi:hypothetical protein